MKVRESNVYGKKIIHAKSRVFLMRNKGTSHTKFEFWKVHQTETRVNFFRPTEYTALQSHFSFSHLSRANYTQIFVRWSTCLYYAIITLEKKSQHRGMRKSDFYGCLKIVSKAN